MSNTVLQAKQADDSLKTPLDPPLKWAGGKRWLVPTLRPLFHKHERCRLVEPFVGGMAVTLGLHPERALLGDLNPHLINFYEQLKAGLVIERTFQNERQYFFTQRSRFNELIQQGSVDSREAAEIFYYLNRTAFNGLCRFNAAGLFNVPFGRYKTINYRYDFNAYASTFARWEFRHGDFQSLSIEPGDFLYIDPPYDVEFTQYSKESFSWSDQVRLVDWLKQLPCPIVASNQATERIIDLYKSAGFEVSTLNAPRRISCTGDRKPALEMLACRGF